MPAIAFIAFTLLPIVGVAGHSYAVAYSPLESISSENATLSYSPGLVPAAERLLEIYHPLVSETEDALGIRMPGGAVQILLLSSSHFHSLSGNRPFMALARPAEMLIAVNHEALRADPLVLRATMKHEVAHLIVHGAALKGIPKWLDEGVCQWASGGHSEIRFRGNGWTITKAALTGRLIPLPALTAEFPPDEQGIQLAYLESLSAVDLLVSRYGSGIITHLLSDMASGIRADEAFLARTGMSLEEFETLWLRHTLRHASLMTFFREHFLDVLFLLGGAALAAGFIRTYYRIKTYKDPEDEDGQSGTDGTGGPGDMQ